MGGRTSNRPFLFVLGLLAVVSAAVPHAAHAQTTALFVDSQPGEYVGGGTTHSHTLADATFTATSTDWGGTNIKVQGPSLVFFWELWLMRGGAARAPLPGVYEGARGTFTGLNGLLVTGNATACSGSTGRFVVLEAEYGSDGSVLSFAADFEQHCTNQDPGLFGAIRYHSSISSLVPFAGEYPRYGLTLTAPLHGAIDGDGLVCGLGGTACLSSHAVPATATLHARAEAGYVFAGWTGECSGGPHTWVRMKMQVRCSAAFVPVAPDGPRTLGVISTIPLVPTDWDPVVVSPPNSEWRVTPWGQGAFKLDIIAIDRTSTVTQSYVVYPPSGQTFKTGVTYTAQATPGATHAGFVSTAADCAGVTFAFRDWEAGSGGAPARFAMDYECGGSTAVLLYNSSYEYPQLLTSNTDLQLTAVRDNIGLVSHSADQVFGITPSAPMVAAWHVTSDQEWLLATPSSGTGAAPAAARIHLVRRDLGAGPLTGHLIITARGIINIPDAVTVTLNLRVIDTVSRPFGVFRPASGTWAMPSQGAQQLGQPGDIPLSGDFDGDGTPDIAIYRPGTGEWLAQGQATRQWGSPGDLPVPADYNGDGVTDLAVFRQSGPFALWFIAGDPTPRAWGLRGDIPVPGDYDGDGIADLAVFRPASGSWWIVRSSTGQTETGVFGLPGDIPVVADFDFDRKVDLAVFRPSTGFWYLRLLTGGDPYIESRQFGLPGDVPVPLDVTGDGCAELRVWRPSTGMWYSYDRTRGQVSSQQYGQPGDVPIMARPVLAGFRPVDFDGDRRADVTVYRPSTGEWFTRQSATGYSTSTTQQWGLADGVPVPGDYDGDRRANAAVYHPSTGDWFVHRFDGTVLQRTWGLAGDVPVPADYDGDGRTDMAVYRPSTGQWFILTSASGYDDDAAVIFSWGMTGDRAAPADFDGDGRADAAVYRPSTGEWFVAPSSGGSFVRQWGLSGDVPIARDFDGDGRADLAVYRGSTGEWFVADAGSGDLMFVRRWGLGNDVPVADDYDGDGAADVAVFHPASGEWSVLPSSGAASFVLQWGLPGDVPVTRR
jgi:FG-GAP-like repeat